MKTIPINRPFRDRSDAEAEGINPYVAAHRAFPEIVPVDVGEGLRGRWGDAFAAPGPLHLEIGSGNGFYLSGMALQHPEWRWIGLEIRFKRVVIAARKLQAAGCTNARLFRFDAFNLDRAFADGELAGVHINHPDPWPKDRQAHRRLISPVILTQLGRLVRPGGELRLKTDFLPHVDALNEAAEPAGWSIVGSSLDVRNQGAPWPNDVCTNYQSKFDALGLPVYAVWAQRR